jgi:uncharacterized protein (TIGR02145 family)
MNIQKSLSSLILFTAIICINCISNLQAQPTVKIGTQIWMARNLNVDKFRNGEIIPQAKTNEEWAKAGINKQPAWCYYNNKPANGSKYGKLYNWYAVNDPRGLAPAGWHMPSELEGRTFFTQYDDPGSGGKLKEAGSLNWKTPNKAATNESGFAGLPGGFCSVNGFFNIGEVGRWWGGEQSSFNNTDFRCSFTLVNVNGKLEVYSNKKDDGLSVRCLKD